MKSVIFILATVAAMTATAAPKVTVLLRDKVSVGWAPPEKLGTYVTDILSNGNVQHTDNKGVKTVIVKISKEAVEKIKTQIAKLEETELYSDGGPECFDAPSLENIVMKDGKEIKIRTQYACVVSQMAGAYELNNIINSASDLHSNLKALK